MDKQFSEEAEKIRFETFVDAILAIIITVLVLEFKVPENAYTSDGEIQSFIRHMMPSFFSYFISFATIVTLWIDHHNLFRSIKKADTKFVLLNFLFVLFVSATPFTTALAGRNYERPYAVALVGANYALMSLSFIFIWAYAEIKKIIPETVAMNKSSKAGKTLGFIGFCFLIASIPLAYASTYITFALFILVIIMHLIKQFFY